MANTVAAGLKRDKVLDTILRAFKKRVLPITAFSTVFRDAMLEGTDKVQVPYYPLDTTASKNYSASTGYEFDSSTDTSSKPVTINKRKYLDLSVTSSEAARQPALDPIQLLSLKAEKLAEDVLADIWSAVTLAAFGAAVKDVAPGNFDSDDVIDIRDACGAAHWPMSGRSLLLSSVYTGALLKDDAIKSLAAFGSPSAQTGMIPKLFGFDVHECDLVPDNSENLAGMAVFPSALLVAFSPVKPHPSVAEKLSRYEVLTDPDTGISIEYRAWGDPDLDAAREVVEVNYGYAVGEAAALKRITDPS